MKILQQIIGEIFDKILLYEINLKNDEDREKLKEISLKIYRWQDLTADDCEFILKNLYEIKKEIDRIDEELKDHREKYIFYITEREAAR